MHFFYGHYYAAHAMHRVGGKEWDDWYVRIKDYLLPRQDPKNGSWTRVDRGEVGPVYQTSIAVIILSVPANYLPIFQRLTDLPGARGARAQNATPLAANRAHWQTTRTAFSLPRWGSVATPPWPPGETLQN